VSRKSGQVAETRFAEGSLWVVDPNEAEANSDGVLIKRRQPAADYAFGQSAGALYSSSFLLTSRRFFYQMH
jgi:hypothetical protein